MQIQIETIQDLITIDNKAYLLTPKNQLQDILNQNANYKTDIEELRQCTLSILRLMGLLDEEKQTLKEEIKSGSQNYFKPILKSLIKVVGLLTEAKMGFKNAEEELLEKFAFIKKILPLIEKHSK